MKPFENGSRVTFIGDSITIGNNFVSRIVDYYHTNLPEIDVKFQNSGVSGGSVGSATLYLDAYTMPFKPNVAVVMLGVNDSGRDLLAQPDSPERNERLESSFERYKTNYPKLCDTLVERGMKVILCTPAPYAEFFDTGTPPLHGGHKLLLRYADFVRKLAKERGFELVDYHARMSEIYLDEPLYNTDRVHPTEAGHARMAECFLTAQGLPVREFVAGEPPAAISPSLDEWRSLVGKLGDIYAVEWMVVRNFTLPDDEKIALVSGLVAQNKWRGIPYFERITTGYLENKPHEAEICARLAEIQG